MKMATLEDISTHREPGNTSNLGMGLENDSGADRDNYNPSLYFNNDPDFGRTSFGSRSTFAESDYSTSKTILQRLERNVIGRIFQMNFMVLKH